MDISSPTIPSVLASLLFLLIIIIITRRRRSQVAPNLPPGPPKLPIIGNLHHLFGSLSHHILRDLAKNYGSLMHLQLGEVSTIIVSSPELAKQVMRTHDMVFSNRPFLPSVNFLTYNSKNLVFAPYGDYWLQLRKICIVELLNPRRVQSYEPVRKRVVSEMIQTIGSQAGSTVNISKLIFSTTIEIILKTAFGEKCKYQDNFIHVVKRTMELAGGFTLPDFFPSKSFLFALTGMKFRCEKVHNEMDRILDGIIKEHRARKREADGDDGQQQEAEDLVQALLDVQDKGGLQFPLTTHNIKAVIMDIFVAGGDTSSTTVEWAISEMLRNPTTMEKAQEEVRAVFSKKGKVEETGLEELKYMKSVIKETLRIHPPAPLLLPRESRERCELNGFTIPSKTRVIVNAWAMGRDPDHWNEPDKFIPERFLGTSVDYKGKNFEFIPFGAGRRICPGISLGLANMELLLAEMLYHFDWKLPHGVRPEELGMTEIFVGIVARRKKELYVTPIPYKAVAAQVKAQ